MQKIYLVIDEFIYLKYSIMFVNYNQVEAEHNPRLHLRAIMSHSQRTCFNMEYIPAKNGCILLK